MRKLTISFPDLFMDLCWVKAVGVVALPMLRDLGLRFAASSYLTV